MPPEQRAVVSKMFATLKRLDTENALLKAKTTKTDQEHRELFALLFVLVRREENKEVRISFSELGLMGLMDSWKLIKEQDKAKMELVLRLVHITDPVPQDGVN